MSSRIPRLCLYCNREAGNKNFRGVFCNLKHEKASVYEALNAMFFQNNEFKSNFSSAEGLCNRCWYSLSKLYSKFTQFQEYRHEESKIFKLNESTVMDLRLVNNKDTEAEVLPVINPEKVQIKPQKILKPREMPISKRIKQISETKPGRVAICTAARNILRKEMYTLSKSTILLGQVEASDDTSLLPLLHEELRSIAPNTLLVLQAIAGKKSTLTLMDPKIGVACCVLAVCRNLRLNRFQKLIGLMLCSISASKDTYAFMNRVGLSTSYYTTKTCAKILGDGEYHDTSIDKLASLFSVPDSSTKRPLTPPEPEEDSIAVRPTTFARIHSGRKKNRVEVEDDQGDADAEISTNEIEIEGLNFMIPTYSRQNSGHTDDLWLDPDSSADESTTPIPDPDTFN